MKKCYIRIHGHRVQELAMAIREASIPFVLVNSSEHHGSKFVIEMVDNEHYEVIVIMVKESDGALVHLINTGCQVSYYIEDDDEMVSLWHRYKSPKWFRDEWEMRG